MSIAPKTPTSILETNVKNSLRQAISWDNVKIVKEILNVSDSEAIDAGIIQELNEFLEGNILKYTAGLGSVEALKFFSQNAEMVNQCDKNAIFLAAYKSSILGTPKDYTQLIKYVIDTFKIDVNTYYEYEWLDNLYSHTYMQLFIYKPEIFEFCMSSGGNVEMPTFKNGEIEHINSQMYCENIINKILVAKEAQKGTSFIDLLVDQKTKPLAEVLELIKARRLITQERGELSQIIRNAHGVKSDDNAKSNIGRKI